MQVQHLICETNGCGQQNQKVQKATYSNNREQFHYHISNTSSRPDTRKGFKELLPRMNWAVECSDANLI